MIRSILGFFGYIKIPKAAIDLSIAQENVFKDIIALIEGEENKELFSKHLKIQRVLTHFLRSGRILNSNRR